MELQADQLLTAAGVLLGFQVTAFTWRIAREVEVARSGDLSWIPPADYLNLLAMVVTAAGVFILPVLGFGSTRIAGLALGLGTVLFVGYCFALAAHYELFNPRTKRTHRYCPRQEQVAVGLVVLLCLVYLFFAIRS